MRMAERLKESYSAAGQFPVKLLHVAPCVGKIIRPAHIQLSPTNACNLACSFCSCDDRDHSHQMDIEDISAALRTFAGLGCLAVTITGGGEPLLYPDIGRLLQTCVELGIAPGLVTNGELFGDAPEEIAHCVWVRASLSDERDLSRIEAGLRSVRRHFPHVDLAISYVVSRFPQMENIARAIRFTQSEGLTHIRIVHDLVDLPGATPMDVLRRAMTRRGVGGDKVIYQDRTQHTRGARRCLISLLKPVLAADGHIYPCCGVQYARQNEKHDFTSLFRMGNIGDILDIWGEQRYFDGGGCHICYYQAYNDLLAMMVDRPEHVEFV